MPTSANANSETTFLRSTILLLAATGVGFVAGTLVQGSGSPSDVSAAFAQPARAAESNFGGPPPPIDVVSLPQAREWNSYDGERILEPRECDLTKGIATACVFMD